MCGKEGRTIDIKRHIESNHLEGVSLPCSQCETTFRTKRRLQEHVSENHKKDTLATLSTTNFSGYLIDLDEIVKSKMETSENMVLNTGLLERGKICKVCVKKRTIY